MTELEKLLGKNIHNKTFPEVMDELSAKWNEITEDTKEVIKIEILGTRAKEELNDITDKFSGTLNV